MLSICWIRRDHVLSRLERVWGPGDGRPVEDLKVAIDQVSPHSTNVVFIAILAMWSSNDVGLVERFITASILELRKYRISQSGVFVSVFMLAHFPSYVIISQNYCRKRYPTTTSGRPMCRLCFYYCRILAARGVPVIAAAG